MFGDKKIFTVEGMGKMSIKGEMIIFVLQLGVPLKIRKMGTKKHLINQGVVS